MVDLADTLAVLVREDATAVDLAVAMERLPDNDCTVNEALSAVRMTGKSAAGSA